MNIRQWLTESQDKYKDDRIGGMKACAEALNVSFKSVQNMAAHVWPLWEKNKDQTLSLDIKSGKSKDIIQPEEFIDSIDVIKHIMDFLNSEVKDGTIEDERLRRRFEIGISKWNEIKRLPIWEGRIFPYTRKDGAKAIVWSSVKTIKRAKETISMTRYEL